jgi:hypothetical protein
VTTETNLVSVLVSFGGVLGFGYTDDEAVQDGGQESRLGAGCTHHHYVLTVGAQTSFLHFSTSVLSPVKCRYYPCLLIGLVYREHID